MSINTIELTDQIASYELKLITATARIDCSHSEYNAAIREFHEIESFLMRLKTLRAQYGDLVAMVKP